MSLTAIETARKSADAMWSRDESSKWLGIALGPVGPGTATLSMTVAAHHCNGHGICHGGFIFTLADTAFAYACNSYNRVTVAQHNTISYVAPGKLGDTLTATAREVSLAGRNGIYDVEIHSGEQLIATFRGCSRTIRGQNFDEGATEK